MKIVQRENINIQKWDALVTGGTNTSVFSLSAYLDAVAENWCILTDENYSGGIALPFTIRLGLKTCYTPIFVRYLEWFGEKSISDLEFIKIIQREFPQGQLNSNLPLVGIATEEFVYQSITREKNLSYNSQSKRMLSKFEKSGLRIVSHSNTGEVMDKIYTELPKKISALNEVSLAKLKILVSVMKQKNLLKILVAKKEDSILGGIFLIEFNNTLLYLKGAFTSDAKKEGAMYGVMQNAINYAKDNNLNFDFGGSRVEGVRRFNINLGGEDQVYYSYNWDNAPFWFKSLKRMKEAWRKK